MTIENEAWRPVPGFAESYEVSSAGRVRSLDRFDSAGRKRVGKVRSLGRDRKGYVVAPLSKNGKQQQRHVHRLVLEAFVGPCPPAMEACHNNGKRADNRLENLRWDTRKANVADAIRHGTFNLTKGPSRKSACCPRCKRPW